MSHRQKGWMVLGQYMATMDCFFCHMIWVIYCWWCSSCFFTVMLWLWLMFVQLNDTEDATSHTYVFFRCLWDIGAWGLQVGVNMVLYNISVLLTQHCSVDFSQQGVVQNVIWYFFRAVRTQCRKGIGMATWHWYTFGSLNWMVLQLCLSRDSWCRVVQKGDVK